MRDESGGCDISGAFPPIAGRIRGARADATGKGDSWENLP
jgi:hypothetical protein